MFSKVLPNDGLKVLDMHYAASVSRRACITPCSMMLAMVYLDQLRHKNPQYMTSVSSCDLFLVSMLVASKFLYDDGEEDEVFNDEWAASANMDLKDLNLLEREFLDALDWNLYIKPKAFAHMLESTENRIAYLESTRRGWLTYTDMFVLSKGAVLERSWMLVYNGVIKVIAVSAVAYLAAAFTLFGSAVLVHKLAHTSQNLLHPPDTVRVLPANTSQCSPLLLTETADIVVHMGSVQPPTHKGSLWAGLTVSPRLAPRVAPKPPVRPACSWGHHPLWAHCVEVAISF